MESMTNAEKLLLEGLDKHIYPAGALAIGCGDRVLVKRTVGTVSYEEGASPVTADTPFDMASCSKVLGTTFCAFHLIEEGMLCLSDTLGDFFPSCPPDKKEITIRQLMTHTSGIAPEIPLYQKCAAPEEAVAVILKEPLDYAAGSETRYSCMGFILLGKIMEQITGKPLNELAELWTFRPLGMKNTHYHPVDSYPADPSCAYTEKETLWGPGVPGHVHDENARFLNGVSGNAGVFSTLHDMILFCKMLSRRGAPLISQPLFEAARHNYTLGMEADNRGLGFQLSGPVPSFFGDLFGNDAIGHTGFTGTSFAVNPDNGLYVILLTNRVCPSRREDRLTRLRHQIHNAAVSQALRELL